MSATIPLDDRDGYIWMDGQMRPWREARVHILTHALHYATAVFEGERAYNSKVFKSRFHAERLFRSGALIRMDMSHFSVDQVESIKPELLAANNLKDAYLRVLVWRGSEALGVGLSGTKAHMAVAAWSWDRVYKREIAAQGIALMTSPWRRMAPNMTPVQSKTTSHYNVGSMAKDEAIAAGYADAMMLDFEGYVAEASAANIFFVMDGTLVTPLADRFLNGITRQTVLELAKTLGLPLEEKRLKPEDIRKAQEAFITGSATEIMPVTKIDDHPYTIGPVTQKLMAAYQDLVSG